MTISIRSNIASLQAQRRLAEGSAKLSAVLERLASGLRINHASDDAAGLAIADSLTADARVFSQAIRNLNDGLSLLNVGDGALQQLSDITMRQRELATQAANGTYSLVQRQALNREANALVDEFNRIVATTEFNGLELFAQGTTDLQLQAGYGDNTIGVALGCALSRAVGDGTFTMAGSYLVGTAPYDVQPYDTNGDGILDLVSADINSSTVSVLIGNGNGTFQARRSFATGGVPVNVAFGDLDRDGVMDVATADNSGNSITVLLGNGNGTFKAKLTYGGGTQSQHVLATDLNRDGILDLANFEMTNKCVGVLLGNGNGTFKARATFETSTDNAYDLLAGDFNDDGLADLATADPNDNTISLYFGRGDGTLRPRVTFKSATSPSELIAEDMNGDGKLDFIVANSSIAAGSNVSVLLGNGNGTYAAYVTYRTADRDLGMLVLDMNGDGLLDVATSNRAANSVSILLGNGDGTLGAKNDFSGGSQPFQVSAGDFNGDGVKDLATADYGSNSTTIFIATTRRSASTPYLNITTRGGALDAMQTLDATLQRISDERGVIGSLQNRVGVAINNLQAGRENYFAAASRIRDADIGAETAELLRVQILQQAAAAVLAQANAQPSIAVTLLGG